MLIDRAAGRSAIAGKRDGPRDYQWYALALVDPTLLP